MCYMFNYATPLQPRLFTMQKTRIKDGQTSPAKYPFSWHYDRERKDRLVLIWDGIEMEVQDIRMYIDLRRNPFGTVWHNKQPVLTVNGTADTLYIDEKNVAHIY